MSSYKNILNYVELSGPTLFNPLILEAKQLATNYKNDPNNDKYAILLILTDGVIHDLSATKDTLV